MTVHDRHDTGRTFVHAVVLNLNKYCLNRKTNYRICLVIRQSFFFQNNPKDLDPS